MRSLLQRNITLSIGLVAAITFLTFLAFTRQAEAFREDGGYTKWSPSWLSSSSRYSPVSSSNYYGGMSAPWGGYPKRLGERSSLYGSQIYKWSPVYFADRGYGFGRGSPSRYLNSITSDGMGMGMDFDDK